MNTEECKALKSGDRIKAGNGQTGIVVLNGEHNITVQFDDGQSVTGLHGRAWMIEHVSSAVLLFPPPLKG